MARWQHARVWWLLSECRKCRRVASSRRERGSHAVPCPKATLERLNNATGSKFGHGEDGPNLQGPEISPLPRPACPGLPAVTAQAVAFFQLGRTGSPAPPHFQTPATCPSNFPFLPAFQIGLNCSNASFPPSPSLHISKVSPIHSFHIQGSILGNFTYVLVLTCKTSM